MAEARVEAGRRGGRGRQKKFSGVSVYAPRIYRLD